MVQLHTSRGAEDGGTIAFMRASVLATEGLVYLAAASGACLLLPRGTWRSPWVRASLFFGLLAPVPLVIIDHGHFQYNGVSLGLVLAWMLGMAANAPAPTALPSRWELASAAAFTLALNFKQMTLYFAPAVFVVHLSSAVAAGRASSTWLGAVGITATRVLLIGCVVLTVQAIMLAPLCLGDSWQECAVTATHVVHRIFPLARGLFEDKVANVWCTLEPLLRMRARLNSGAVGLPTVLGAATALTVLGNVPAGVLAWRAGPALRKAGTVVSGTRDIVLALVIGSLAFFLLSFQAHEKTILLPATLAAVLDLVGSPPRVSEASSALQWTALISMAPLLIRDGLGAQLAALALVQAARMAAAWHSASTLSAAAMGLVAGVQAVLAVACAWAPAPTSLPDLWPFLLSACSCAVLCAVWLVLSFEAASGAASVKEKQS